MLVKGWQGFHRFFPKASSAGSGKSSGIMILRGLFTLRPLLWPLRGPTSARTRPNIGGYVTSRPLFLQIPLCVNIGETPEPLEIGLQMGGER
jgi:hypothetical protein